MTKDVTTKLSIALQSAHIITSRKSKRVKRTSIKNIYEYLHKDYVFTGDYIVAHYR